jgi:KUP system potassium uptake protein
MTRSWLGARFWARHRETVVRREDGLGLPAWQGRLFAVMERNAVHVSDVFSLPTDQVVEIGRQVAI